MVNFVQSYNPTGFGWSNNDPVKPFAYKGVSFPAGLNARPSVSIIFTAFLDELVPQIPGGLVAGECWGKDYSDKDPNSFHLPGIAIDINAPQNPQTAHAHSFVGAHVLPKNTGIIARKYYIEWGGLWTPNTPPDYMHAELHLTPTDSDLFAATLTATPHPVPKPPVHIPPVSTYTPYYNGALGTRLWQLNDQGADVAAFQKIFNQWYPTYPQLVVDGKAGPNTITALKYLQTRLGITPDGVFGPNTAKGINVTWKG